MIDVREILFTISHPSLWSRLYATNLEWDKYLNDLMDEFPFTDFTEHTVRLNGKLIWIANHPYASFRPYAPYHNNHGWNITSGNTFNLLPRRSTVYRAIKKYKSDQTRALLYRPLTVD